MEKLIDNKLTSSIKILHDKIIEEKINKSYKKLSFHKKYKYVAMTILNKYMNNS